LDILHRNGMFGCRLFSSGQPGLPILGFQP
jgi:hypothetical protein